MSHVSGTEGSQEKFLGNSNICSFLNDKYQCLPTTAKIASTILSSSTQEGVASCIVASQIDTAEYTTGIVPVDA